jgi:hypothetical protein
MAFLNPRQRANFESLYIPEPTSGCFIWTGYVNSWGYGQFNVKGRIWKAHRAAYEDAKGPIPEGLLVLHRCDNPACVNPDHLRLGTDVDNAREKATRKRVPTKISEDQVRSIRAATGRYREIADKYKISAAWVCRIKAGQGRPYVKGTS